MWFTYSVLNDSYNNHIFHRIRNINSIDKTILTFEPGFINISMPDYSGKLKIKIYDVTGKAVLVENQSINNYLKLPIQPFLNGIYLISLTDDSGKTTTNKIFIY